MTSHKNPLKLISLSVLMALTGFMLSSTTAKSTFISPPRVVIDADKVAGEMLILNRSDKAKVYSFKWEDRAMRPDGTIATGGDLKDAVGYRPASAFLAYSPRKVILEPGKSQRIRFFVKRNKMTDGEYRSHILIGARPLEERKTEVVEGLGGTIGIVAQAGIPVMVRHRKTKVEIEPEFFKLIKEDGEDLLHVKFVNKSTRTLYAKPTMICQRAGEPEPERIEAMSIRMYYERIYVDEKLRIWKEEPNLEGCQSIRLEFTDRLDFEYAHKPFYTQVLK